MPTEEGIVKAAYGELALVMTKRGAMCSSCKANDMCHSLGGGEDMEVEALNRVSARSGDRVRIELSDKALLWASLQVYLIPPLFLLFGAILGQHLAPRWGLDANLAALLFGFGAFALVFAVVKVRAKRDTKRNLYRPTVVEITQRAAPRTPPE